ncbi:MAG: copper-binding protein [Candidatus Nitrosopumilus limneticus]|nr:copper-binding protein [Candidatus Nitrosopumilus limneticus]
MSNWDLLMPGMGLTGVGLAGLILAYSGIAHTFIDGMHALTGLTMFVGLIFTAAGILDGGISTSKRAKITTLVIVAIALGFGIYALATINTSDFTLTVVLILLAVALPALAIGYIAMKKPGSIKPIGLVLGLAVASAMVIWITVGAMNQGEGEIAEEITDEETMEEMVTGPIFAIEILKDSAQQENPDYNPDRAIVTQGYTMEWTNADVAAHTVTSSIDFGETFDSSLISPGETYTLDSTNLEIGEHEYFCIVHPWMIATLVIEATVPQTIQEPVVETIQEPVVEELIVSQTVIKTADNSGMSMDCQAASDCYTPNTITVNAGSVVTMINSDSAAAMHSFTAGTVDGFSPSPSGTFDTGIMYEEDSFEWTPETAGEVPYYCMLHTWMQGTIIVE